MRGSSMAAGLGLLRRHALGVAIVLLWLGMMGRLVHRHHQGPSLASLATGNAVSAEASEEWMGIYQQGGKVGYSHRTLEPERGGYLLQDQTYLELSMQGFPLTVSMSTRGLTGPDLGLRSFRFELQSGLVETTIQGAVDGNRLRLRMVTAGSESSQILEFYSRPTLPGSVSVLLRRQPLKVGQRFSLPVLDPATLALKDLEVEVKGEDFVDLEGEAVPAYRLTTTFAGLTVESWVDSQGHTLKENTPLGWEVVRESRENALTRGWKSGVKVDMARATSVEVRGVRIPNPRDTRLLLIQFPPEPTEGLDLAGDRQEMRSGQLPLLLIRREDLQSLEPVQIPVERPELKPDLASDLFVQADHPEIVEQARRIAGEERDALAVARLLLRWVHDNLEKRVVPSLPNALEVLHRKVGDCNEHTVLYVALARALGLPARINAGLVFVDDRFYYHAWPDVFVGQWVSLDPVFDQLPADATHIRLVRGGLERQVEIVRLIGNLRILGILDAK